jgi:hypothetical protein
VTAFLVRKNKSTDYVTNSAYFTANGTSYVDYVSGKAEKDKNYCLRAQIVNTCAYSKTNLKYTIVP